MKQNVVLTQEVFATDYAYELVKKGIPFRDAYKEVAKKLEKLEKINSIRSIQSKKHIGATGNLGLGKLKQNIKSMNIEVDSEIKKFNENIKGLLE